ncbi:MAG: IPT/TIG domain-containing protein, partial [Bryobacteraceae bacterium]|nr:IPT/TIG domain-containing protein [Bryobacteraceae bacterium]
MHIRIALASLVCCAGLQAQISVVNAASFRQQPGVAAGSFASAFGSFAGATTTAAAALPFPTSLGGVTVTVGGTAAPLQYVSSTQINFLVPAAVTPGLRPIVVTSGSATLNGNVRVVTAAPGLSTQDTATPPKGAIQNQDASLNTSANPARRGQLVQLF